MTDPGRSAEKDTPETMTRRRWLTVQALMRTGCDIFTATEAVASTAIEHPEWDMEERRTWDQWERDA